MEIVMLLLVSALVQLASPAAVTAVQNPQNNLNRIIDLVSDFNTSFIKEYYVEDVDNTGCENKFFCKVYDVLYHHEIVEKKLEKDLEKIVRNLWKYLDDSKINCTNILEMGPKSEVEKPITVLLDKLSDCTRRKNFKGHK